MALMPLGVLCVFAMSLLPDPAALESGFFTSPGVSSNQQFPDGPELLAFRRALPEIPIVEEFPAAETPAPQSRGQTGPQTPANPPLLRPNSTDWQFVEVRPGDTLSELFAELEIDPVDLSLLLRSGEEAAVLNRMKVGYELGFKLDGSGRLDAFRLLRSPFDELAFTRSGEGFQIEPIQHIPRVETGIKGGTVHSSLYAAAQRHEVSPNQSMRMVDIFGGKIDFMLDTQPGDQFTILYEEQYIEDRYVGEGDILVARFVNRGEEHLAVRYESLNGWVGFYSPDGDSMRTAMMRNPLDVFRISSSFNPRRMHPILNTIRPHTGTDYAAPTGTPVRATSDGSVTRASRYGSYGNIVIIAHAGGLETRYAHLSKFAEGIRPGTRVSQGDVIGFVGATGRATGPHLHYEVLKDGVARDPVRVHELMPVAPGIDASEMDRFHSHAQTLLAQFDTRQEELLRNNAGVSAD